MNREHAQAILDADTQSEYRGFREWQISELSRIVAEKRNQGQPYDEEAILNDLQMVKLERDGQATGMVVRTIMKAAEAAGMTPYVLATYAAIILASERTGEGGEVNAPIARELILLSFPPVPETSGAE